MENENEKEGRCKKESVAKAWESYQWNQIKKQNV